MTYAASARNCALATERRISMQTGQPSRTALAAAAMRAAHQTLDGGRIFNDPIAHAVLGPEADAMINVLEMSPVGDAIYARAVLAAAADAEGPFGAVIDDPSAAGEEVAGTGLYAG